MNSQCSKCSFWYKVSDSKYACEEAPNVIVIVFGVLFVLIVIIIITIIIYFLFKLMIRHIKANEFNKGTFDLRECNVNFVNLNEIENEEKEDDIEIKLDKHEKLSIVVNENKFTFINENDPDKRIDVGEEYVDTDTYDQIRHLKEYLKEQTKNIKILIYLQILKIIPQPEKILI